MASDPTTVQTRKGSLRGSLEDGIHVFRGVPYAQPPVGDLRWRRPQPLEPWDGVREAVDFGPISMQPPRPAAGPFAGHHGPQPGADVRRLPLSQCLDARTRRPPPTCHGLDSRRWAEQWLGLVAGLRWRAARLPRRRGHRHDQLPARRTRLPARPGPRR